MLLGNWFRYGGARAGDRGNFGLVMFGQILTGLAQPFVLSAPARYSDLWFTNRGRVAATAVTTLANPFGAALGQLIVPFWVNSPADIPNMVLWVAIIVRSLPEPLVPHTAPLPRRPPWLTLPARAVVRLRRPLLLHPQGAANARRAVERDAQGAAAGLAAHRVPQP